MNSRAVVLLDACVLINLFHVGRTDLLEGLAGYDFRITTQVQSEITEPDQIEELELLIEQGILHIEPVTDVAIVLDTERLMKRIQAGEASCIALAKHTGWIVGTDDKKARSMAAEDKSLRILTTPELLVVAIQRGLLSIEEADRIKVQLEEHRFTMAFGSFRDVV